MVEVPFAAVVAISFARCAFSIAKSIVSEDSLISFFIELTLAVNIPILFNFLFELTILTDSIGSSVMELTRFPVVNCSVSFAKSAYLLFI